LILEIESVSRPGMCAPTMNMDIQIFTFILQAASSTLRFETYID